MCLCTAFPSTSTRPRRSTRSLPGSRVAWRGASRGWTRPTSAAGRCPGTARAPPRIARTQPGTTSRSAWHFSGRQSADELFEGSPTACCAKLQVIASGALDEAQLHHVQTGALKAEAEEEAEEEVQPPEARGEQPGGRRPHTPRSPPPAMRHAGAAARAGRVGVRRGRRRRRLRRGRGLLTAAPGPGQRLSRDLAPLRPWLAPTPAHGQLVGQGACVGGPRLL